MAVLLLKSVNYNDGCQSNLLTAQIMVVECDEPCLGFEKEEEEDKNDINPKAYMTGIYTQDKEREKGYISL